MNRDNYEYERKSNLPGVLVGALIGGLAGAVAMLLLAPQAGEETRRQIQEKGVELRDRTTAMLDDVVTKARSSADKLTNEGRGKLKELKQHGQELAVEQLDRVSKAVKVGKKVVRNS